LPQQIRRIRLGGSPDHVVVSYPIRMRENIAQPNRLTEALDALREA